MIVDIGFSTSKGFNLISWVIRKFTRSECSHALFLYWDANLNMRMIMEAQPTGFQLTPYSVFEKNNKLISVIRPKHDITDGLIKVANEYLGTRYDYLGALGMAWVEIGSFIKRKWRNPFVDSKHVFCSEAVVRAIKASPGYKNLDINPDETGPQELLELMRKGI